MWYDVLLAGAVGIVVTLFAVGFSAMRKSILLKRCLVSREDTDTPTFEYKGKLYDKGKYLQLRSKSLSWKRKGELRSLLKKAKIVSGYRADDVFNLLEIEALTVALENQTE